MERNRYYDAAIEADERLSHTLMQLTGRTRWTLRAEDYYIPAVREAIKAKIDADMVWLSWLQAAQQKGAYSNE